MACKCCLSVGVITLGFRGFTGLGVWGVGGVGCECPTCTQLKHPQRQDVGHGAMHCGKPTLGFFGCRAEFH